MNQQVKCVFDSYPKEIRAKILKLRQLILDTAQSMGKDIEETLKWNEPSYLTMGGSTIRIAWRKSYPNQYGIFFNCKTLLIETFKEIYPNKFNYEGNRAMVFELGDVLPKKELQHCIQLSLNYHSIKHLPMLGV